jgi:hypothetical protein
VGCRYKVTSKASPTKNLLVALLYYVMAANKFTTAASRNINRYPICEENNAPGIPPGVRTTNEMASERTIEHTSFMVLKFQVLTAASIKVTCLLGSSAAQSVGYLQCYEGSAYSMSRPNDGGSKHL